MIWGPPYPSVLRSAQRGAGRTNTSAPPSSPLFSKGAVAAPRTPPGRGYTPAGVTEQGQSHPRSHHPWDGPATKSPLQFLHGFHPSLLRHGSSPPHRASNPCTFHKPSRGYRSHTAAPCLLLRDRGPWPRFFPRFFYISVLISPLLEEATHLLQARGERRMKK